MKLLESKGRNYAYNINSTTNTNFHKNLFNNNFYEDLYKSDKTITNFKKALMDIKTSTIKETVYANKIIPKTWKNMLDYQDRVYRAIDNDPEFARYLGRAKEEETKGFGDSQSQGNKEGGEEQKKTLFKITEKSEKTPKDMENSLLKGEDNSMNRALMNDAISSVTAHSKGSEGNSAFKPGTTRSILEGKQKQTEKLIMCKLDELKNEFDLGKLMKEFENKAKKENNIYEEGNKKASAKELPLIGNRLNKKLDFREMRKMRLKSNKQKVLKESIYSNLLKKEDEDEEVIKEKLKKLQEKERKKKLLQSQPSGPLFLNTNPDFYKKIEINNPEIKRDLEIINYYGPHYPYCHACNIRNMEFYKNGEVNQTKTLLQFLKKFKIWLGQETEKTKE